MYIKKPLPKKLNGDLVFVLRQLEKEQSNEWKDIFSSLTFQQKKDYAKIKRSQQLEENEKMKIQWTFSDWIANEYKMNNYFASIDYTLIDDELIGQKVEKRSIPDKTEIFTFFWETSSPFSQWFKCKFSAPSYYWNKQFLIQLEKNGFPEYQIFNSAEQFMMYNKAMLFLDLDCAKEIMSTNNARTIKNLGRSVKNFNEQTWKVFRWQIVYTGNKNKFTQNEALKEVLIGTSGTTLVEASPEDQIWGIGLTKNDPLANSRKTWKGKNLLGEILTELRIELAGKY